VPFFNTQRTITIDNVFTSQQLTTQLHERGTALVGTMRKNRREIPNLMLRAGREDVGRTEFLYQPNRVLVKFVPKYWRTIVLLSTAHRKKGVAADNGKPVIINFYNSTKIGVDMKNQWIYERTVTRKTRR